MKYNKVIQIVLLYLVLLFGSTLSFSYAQSNGALETLNQKGFYGKSDINPMDSLNAERNQKLSGSMLLLDRSPLSDSLFNSDGFAALFNTLLNIIITLAAIWAVIELSYYGAKYALIDSFTGKKDAIKNIWPVVYGLIALLGIYLFFKQINPKILELELNNKSDNNINLNKKIEPVKKGVDLPVNLKSVPNSYNNNLRTSVNLPFNAKSKEDAEKIRANTKYALEACNSFEDNDKKNCRNFVRDIKTCSNLAYTNENTPQSQKTLILSACNRIDIKDDANKKYLNIYEILLKDS